MSIAGAIIVIKKKREDLGFSQEYVAGQLGISQPAYAKIESGETTLSLERAVELTKVLEIPLSELEAVLNNGINVNATDFKDYASVIQNYNTSPKELYERQIEHLSKEIEYFQKTLQQKEEQITILLNKLK